MDPSNGKTPALSGVCQCAELCLICYGNSTTDTPKIQPPPMGSASSAILRRYADDLRPFAERGDRLATSMLECCDFLLIESDRLQRARP